MVSKSRASRDWLPCFRVRIANRVYRNSNVISETSGDFKENVLNPKAQSKPVYILRQYRKDLRG